jgi:hypothetical protein
MVSLAQKDNGLNLEDKLDVYNNLLKDFFEKNVKILNEIKKNFKVISYTYNILSFIIAVYSKNYEGFLDAQYKIYNDNKVGLFQYIPESKFDEYEFKTFKSDEKISLLLNIQNIAQFCYEIEGRNIINDKLPDSKINFNDFHKKFYEIKC